MKNKKFTQPWFIRRTAYLLVGAVLLIAAGVGLVDEGQIDAITASPVLGTLVAWIAASFTHQGSDSTATDEDRVLAQTAAPAADVVDIALASVTRMEGAVQEVINLLGAVRPQDVAAAVLTAIRAEERGEHDAVTTGTAPASVPGILAATGAAVPGTADTKSVAAYYRGE